MSATVFPALDIQQQPGADPLGQMGKMLALRQQMQQQQLFPLQLQAYQQQVQLGALGLPEKQLQLRSQLAMYRAMMDEFGPKEDQTGQQAAPTPSDQGAAPQPPAPPPGGGLTPDQTAPAQPIPTTPATAPLQPIPTTPGAAPLEPIPPAAKPAPTTAQLATPTAAPAPQPTTGDFLGKMQRMLTKAANNGAMPDDIIGMYGKILQSQDTFAKMTDTQQKIAVTQNKNAGGAAANILDVDPVQQPAAWAQLQQQMRSNPDAPLLYGQELYNYVVSNPYPGQQAVQLHLGAIRARADMLADQEKQLQNKKLAEDVMPFDEPDRLQYNKALGDSWFAQTGKTIPPEFLLKPGDGKQQLDNINHAAEAMFNSGIVKARTAGMEAWARVGPDVEAERRKLIMRQSMYPDPLVGVNPQFASRAAADAAKAGESYVQAQAAAQTMQSMIDMMRSGNKLAYSYEPTMGVLSINQGLQSKRLNRSEIEQYGGAGDAWDRVVAWFGKQVSGESVPPNIVNDIEQVHRQLANNSADIYNRSLAVTNSIYGSRFQPVDLPPLTAPTAPNANRPAAAVSVSVPMPGGGTKTYNFPDQKSADAFKQKAGIK